MCRGTFRRAASSRLNESPSEKEGKSEKVRCELESAKPQ